MIRKISGFLMILAAILLQGRRQETSYDALNALTTQLPLLFVGFSLVRKEEGNSVYASSLQRAAALLIDGIILAIPFVLVLVFASGASAFAFTLMFFLMSLGVHLLWIYLIWKYGATPGKKAMGIQVVRDDLGPLHFKHALKRGSVDLALAITSGAAMMASVSAACPSFDLLNFRDRMACFTRRELDAYGAINLLQNYWFASEVIVMTFNRRRKALHDYLASTVVVNKRSLP
jgi:uncharacterized RDD family membrane protein YckC